MNYKIIESGSTGNAVIIENILIDCGVAYKKLEKELYNVDYLFITHVHGDHLKVKTVEMIRRKFPRIKIIANYEVAFKIPVDTISNDSVTIECNTFDLTPIHAVHDVECQGVIIKFRNGIDIIYMTDSAKVDMRHYDMLFDYIFLESNHDEDKINLIMHSNQNGYKAFDNAKRHLSTQRCKAFYYLARKSKESELIELHKSKRFY